MIEVESYAYDADWAGAYAVGTDRYRLEYCE